MTFFQPHQKKGFLNALIVVLVFSLFLGSLFLIRIYNSYVNLEQNVSNLNKQIKDLQTQDADIQDRIFALFGTDNTAAIAQEEGLIMDNNPQYLKLSTVNESVALQP